MQIKAKWNYDSAHPDSSSFNPIVLDVVCYLSSCFQSNLSYQKKSIATYTSINSWNTGEAKFVAIIVARDYDITYHLRKYRHCLGRKNPYFFSFLIA